MCNLNIQHLGKDKLMSTSTTTCLKNAFQKPLLVLIGTGLSFGTILPALAQNVLVTQPINPKSTYIRSSPPDVGALDAIAFNLMELGISPGDTIGLKQLGAFRAIGNPGPEESIGMGGIFSSSNTLLDRSLLNRVPNAIDAGIESFTGLTNLGNLPTDIPEDFRITDIQIEVPIGAAFLFVGALDSQFLDNTDLDNNFAVQISKVSPPATPTTVPEPNAISGLLLLSLGWFVKKWTIH